MLSPLIFNKLKSIKAAAPLGSGGCISGGFAILDYGCGGFNALWGSYVPCCPSCSDALYLTGFYHRAQNGFHGGGADIGEDFTYLGFGKGDQAV